MNQYRYRCFIPKQVQWKKYRTETCTENVYVINDQYRLLTMVYQVGSRLNMQGPNFLKRHTVNMDVKFN